MVVTNCSQSSILAVVSQDKIPDCGFDHSAHFLVPQYVSAKINWPALIYIPASLPQRTRTQDGEKQEFGRRKGGDMEGGERELKNR